MQPGSAVCYDILDVLRCVTAGQKGLKTVEVCRWQSVEGMTLGETVVVVSFIFSRRPKQNH